MVQTGAIHVEEREELLPVCPHCEKELSSLHSRLLTGGMGRRYVYFCPHCSRVLGISHRKGFWMG